MQLLNRHQVAERVSLSVSSVKRLEAAGRFPKRMQTSENRVAWLLSEVDAWIAERVAERDAAPETGVKKRARERDQAEKIAARAAESVPDGAEEKARDCDRPEARETA